MNKINQQNHYFMRAFVIVFMLFQVIFFTRASAQEVVASGGGHETAGDISLSWTLGELAIETLVTGDLILTQGFNQGSLIVTSTEDLASPAMQIQAYPNPVRDYLIIELPDADPDGLHFHVYDQSGGLLASETIHSSLQKVFFGDKQPGVYLIRFMQDDRPIKSIQVVKQ